MIFLTEHKTKNVDTPRIYANNWSDAESICPDNLRVIGIFIKELECNINLN